MLTYHGLLTLFDDVSGADLASNDKVDRCNTIIKSRGFCPADTVASATRNSTLKANSRRHPEAVLRKLTIHGIAVKRTSWNI